MSDQITLQFTVSSTDYSVPLGIRVSLDNTVFYENAHVMSETQIQHQLLDDDGDHDVVFELFGKTHDHTTVDADGNIVSDAVLTIADVETDGINIDYLFQSLAVYHHDFNGSQAPQQDKFYGHMGCNGTVQLKFSTPFYLWLLENM